MPRFGPVKRSDLIRYLKELGFQGPYEGGRHGNNFRRRNY